MTKKCPFCSEEILIDAIKCKHCGEWLNKKASKGFLSNIVDKTKGFVEDKKELYKFLKTNHLRTPSEDNPVKIKDLIIYPDRLLYGGKQFLIKDIRWILYQPSITTVNFGGNYDLAFACGVTDSATNADFNLTIASSMAKSVIGRGTNLLKREFEQLQMIYLLISEVSYGNREQWMLNEIKKMGYFEYMDTQFHESGDIIKKGKVICNLFERHSLGLVSFGTKYKGLHSSSTDPYAFVIEKKNAIKGKLIGIELGLLLKIQVLVNTDIFIKIVSHLIEQRKFPN